MAYINPTVTAAPQPDGGGAWRVQLTFTGDAGEEPVSRIHTISPTHTAQEIQYRVNEIKAELNASKTIAVGVPAIGQTITPLVRPTPPGPTAEEIARSRWTNDVMSLGRMLALGAFSGALATDIAAYKATLETRYNALPAGERGLASGWAYFRTAGLR